MPGSTANRHYPYPVDGDPVDVALDIKKLADAVDLDAFTSPARGVVDRKFVSVAQSFAGTETVITGFAGIKASNLANRFTSIRMGLWIKNDTNQSAAVAGVPLAFNLRRGTTVGGQLLAGFALMWPPFSGIAALGNYFFGDFSPLALPANDTLCITATSGGGFSQTIQAAGSWAASYDEGDTAPGV